MSDGLDVGLIWKRAEEALRKGHYQEAMEYYLAWKESALKILKESPNAFSAKDLASADYCVGICHYYLGHFEVSKQMLIADLHQKKAASVARNESLGHHFNNNFRRYLSIILAFGTMALSESSPAFREEGSAPYFHCLHQVVADWENMLDDKYTRKLIAKGLIDEREI